MSFRFCLFGFALASPLFAQDLLKPLVVTASRLEQSVENVPYTMDVIGSDFIEQNSRRTLPEALQYTPGVLVQKTAYGQGSPFIRGFTGRQNLLLVDGIRINNSTFRSGPVQYWNTVDSLSLDHMELVKSQGSVLYGSDAIGGTLAAFTKSSSFKNQEAGQLFSTGSAMYEYRANGQGSNIGRLETDTGIGGKFGFWLGISAKDFGDIQGASVGRMKGTGYPEQDVDLRMDWAVTPESTFTFAYQYVNQDDISRWHRTLNNPGWEHGDHFAAPGTWTTDNYNQKRTLTYLRYAGTNPQQDAFISRWNAAVSWQTSEDVEFQNRFPAEDSIRHSEIDLNTFGIDLTLESKCGPGSLIYGFDYYHDDVDSSGSKNNRAGTKYKESLPIADDSEYDLFGIFTQYVWKPVQPLEITGGARYTYAAADLGHFNDLSGKTAPSESESWDSVVGSLRALYHIDSAWSVFGGVSQSFRAPNLDDLTGNMTAKSGSTSLGSTDVESEKFLTYEIGARHNSEKISLCASAFYTDARDQIASVPIKQGGKDTIAVNDTDGYIYGFELEGAWKFHPQWTASGFAAWQDGKTKSPLYLDGPAEEKSMSRLLPLTGSLALRWTAPSEKYWVEGRVLAAATEDRISAEDQAADAQRIPTNGTPSYVVASLHAGWKVCDNLDLSCGVENLTDTDYRIHGSGQNEPGFTGIFRAKVSW